MAEQPPRQRPATLIEALVRLAEDVVREDRRERRERRERANITVVQGGRRNAA